MPADGLLVGLGRGWGGAGGALRIQGREDLRTGQREKPANRVVATETQVI